ncbi:MAG TPA: PGPGW domain-containing protein [Gemmatimonadaceae bacterium]|nr:PGPGW domain-containing protein [Gemmatimonadaceae bacterium]
MSHQEAATGRADSATPSALRFARKVVVAVIGASVLAFGIALIVLPGPAVIVIPLGLAILGTEFLWARRLLRRVRQGVASVFRGKRDR